MMKIVYTNPKIVSLMSSIDELNKQYEQASSELAEINTEWNRANIAELRLLSPQRSGFNNLIQNIKRQISIKRKEMYQLQIEELKKHIEITQSLRPDQKMSNMYMKSEICKIESYQSK